MDYDTAELCGGPRDGEILAIMPGTDRISIVRPKHPIQWESDSIEAIATQLGYYDRRAIGSFKFDWMGWKD